MSGSPKGIWTAELAGLFDAGTCAGVSDAELLERFRTARDEAGERAFEALVTRHGPMVLGICRRMLDDHGEVDDAFQAVFLVLARRAGAIRRGDSVGSWLHGVAVRLCSRTRAASIRRRVRDRRVLSAVATAAAGAGAYTDLAVEHDDGARVVHEEVVRLPESYRAPVVLCYFEGLTHDEAAARLSCPVGTVRSRLARARDQLRTRLTRRGIAAPSAVGPFATWLGGGSSPSPAAIRAAMAADLPANVPASLARAAVRLAADRTPAVGVWSPASIAMADGVLKTMMIKNLAVAGAVILSLGVGTGGGLVMTGRAGAQAPTAPSATSAARAADNTTPMPIVGAPAADPLVLQLLRSAQERFDAQRSSYEEGRITIDRFIDACQQLERAKLLAATDEVGRQDIRKNHVALLREIVNREQAELLVGRGTAADVAEARQSLEQAELDLKTREQATDDYQAKARQLVETARNRYEFQMAFFKKGRITIDRIADASRQLSEAEQRTARSDFDRVASRKHHVDRLKDVEEYEEAEMKAGRGTTSDVAEARTRRIEAELDLHDALASKTAADLSPLLRRLDELERKVEQLQKKPVTAGSPH